MLKNLMLVFLLALPGTLIHANSIEILDVDEEVQHLPCYPDCSLEEELYYSEAMTEWQLTDLADPQTFSQPEDQFNLAASSEKALYDKLSKASFGIDNFPYSALKKQVNYFFANSSRIKNKNFLALLDYRKASKFRRLFVFDTRSGSMTPHYAAHGVNSGGLYATEFSNIEGSKQSTLGFLMTGSTYYGKNGKSLNLHGLENKNDRAFERRIVLHKANYVSDEYIRQHGQAGNSWGCPAVSNADHFLVDRLAGGTLIYHYFN